MARNHVFFSFHCKYRGGNEPGGEKVLLARTHLNYSKVDRVLANVSKRYTVVFPKEGQSRFAGQASKSHICAMFWTADNRNNLFLDLERYPRKLALRVTWPSFRNTTLVYEALL
jgi:hypothetical protein